MFCQMSRVHAPGKQSQTPKSSSSPIILLLTRLPSTTTHVSVSLCYSPDYRLMQSPSASPFTVHKALALNP